MSRCMVVADLKLLQHSNGFQPIFEWLCWQYLYDFSYFTYTFCLQITCKVRAKFTNNPVHPWSDHLAVQQPFFAGINVRRNMFTPLLYLNAWKSATQVMIFVLKFVMSDPTRRKWRNLINCFLHSIERILFMPFFIHAALGMSRGYSSRMPGNFRVWPPSWTHWHIWPRYHADIDLMPDKMNLDYQAVLYCEFQMYKFVILVVSQTNTQILVKIKAARHTERTFLIYDYF